MDLSKHYAEKWVDYPFEEGLSFLLRFYPDELRLSLVKKHTTVGAKGKEIFNNEAFAKEAINHMIKDWRGMKNKGKPVKITMELKFKLISIAPEITEWISTVCQLRNVFHHDIDGILKNFTRLSDTENNGHKLKVVTEVE
jgi:hypothetical protein